MRKKTPYLRIIIYILFSAIMPEVSASDILDRMISDPSVKEESTAVIVKDLKTDRILESHNASLPLTPASIMKAVTIASLIDETGIDYHYKTRVYYSGHINSGVVEGNLIITGSGDPSLNAKCAPGSSDFVQEITQSLVKRKITEIKGRLIFDESAFSGPDIPPSWAPGDLTHAYGTAPHAFNFEGNRSGKSAVKNPAAVFERKLKESLSSAGIVISDAVIRDDGRRLLCEHVSAPIDEIMRSCMMRSDNLFAECLLRTIAMEKGKAGSTENGATLSLAHWEHKGAQTDGVKIYDGSGLSRSNKVTARFMTDVLTAKSPDPDYASFFPLAGQEGTLRNFLKETPLDGYIALKTGSMNGIQCYAGYKLDDDYAPTHTIVIILNGFSSRSGVKKAVSQFLLDLFSGTEYDQNNNNG